MIKSEDEAAAQAAHQAAASGNFMHVGSSARLLSRSPHNNNTLHGEQQLLILGRKLRNIMKTQGFISIIQR